jgi:hypothetical protein
MRLGEKKVSVMSCLGNDRISFVPPILSPCIDRKESSLNVGQRWFSDGFGGREKANQVLLVLYVHG